MPLRKLTGIFDENLLVPVQRMFQATGISGFRTGTIDAMIVYQMNGLPGTLDQHVRLDIITHEDEAHRAAVHLISMLRELSARSYMVFVSPLEDLF